MARRTGRPAPTAEQTLAPATTTCVACGHHPQVQSDCRPHLVLAG